MSVSQPPVPSRPVPNTEQRHVAKSSAAPLTDPPADAGTPAAGAALSLLLIEETAPKTAAPAERVFDHWRTATKHPRAQLDAKRRTLILRALKAYSAEDLCRAIDGYARSPFHQGQNDRSQRYDGLDLILRDAGKIEAGWDLAAKHVPAPESPSRPRPPSSDVPRGPIATPEQRRAAAEAVRADIAAMRAAREEAAETAAAKQREAV